MFYEEDDLADSFRDISEKLQKAITDVIGFNKFTESNTSHQKHFKDLNHNTLEYTPEEL